MKSNNLYLYVLCDLQLATIEKYLEQLFCHPKLCANLKAKTIAAKIHCFVFYSYEMLVSDRYLYLLLKLRHDEFMYNINYKILTNMPKLTAL